jgi:hypothetical protein
LCADDFPELDLAGSSLADEISNDDDFYKTFESYVAALKKGDLDFLYGLAGPHIQDDMSKDIFKSLFFEDWKLKGFKSLCTKVITKESPAQKTAVIIFESREQYQHSYSYGVLVWKKHGDKWCYENIPFDNTKFGVSVKYPPGMVD